MATDELYPQQITQEEQDAGFALMEIPSPPPVYFGKPTTIKVVVRGLPGGKRAVKMTDMDGDITYAIWNGVKPLPVERQAYSLEDLLTRYPSQT